MLWVRNEFQSRFNFANISDIFLLTTPIVCAANKSLYYMRNDEVLMKIINNPTFPVDTFFFMSGFLSSYIFLKEKQKMKRTLSITERANMFIQVIIKRYIRYR